MKIFGNYTIVMFLLFSFFCESLSALSFLAAVVLTAVFFVVASCVKNGHIYRARGIGAVYPLFIFCEL